MIVLFFFFFKQKTAYEMLRSLVGSEMCIRDSTRSVIPRPRAVTPGSARPLPAHRSVAWNSLSSALRILARTPAMSFSLSVRSGERMTTRSARERLSAGTWSPS